MWAKRPIAARFFFEHFWREINNFNMDCTIMKKPPSQTLFVYSILSLAVSPELYDRFIGGFSLLLSFQKGALDRISVFREGVTVDLFKGVKVFT